MILFFVALFGVGFVGASFAPVGPCVVHSEGCYSSCSLVFRNTGSGASCEKPLLAVDFYASAHPVPARRSSYPCSPSCSPFRYHLEEGGGTVAAIAPISGLGEWTQAATTPAVLVNPTRSIMTPPWILRVYMYPIPGLATRTLGVYVGPVWSPNFWTGQSPVSSLSGSASSWLLGGRLRACSLDPDLRVGEV